MTSLFYEIQGRERKTSSPSGGARGSIWIDVEEAEIFLLNGTSKVSLSGGTAPLAGTVDAINVTGLDDAILDAIAPASILNSAGAYSLIPANRGATVILDSNIATDVITVDGTLIGAQFYTTFVNTTSATINVTVSNVTSVNFRNGGAVTDIITDGEFEVLANTTVWMALSGGEIQLSRSSSGTGTGPITSTDVTDFTNAVQDIIAPVSILNSAGAHSLIPANRGATVILDSNVVTDVITVDGTVIGNQFFTTFVNITATTISVTVSNITSVNFRSGGAVNDIVAAGSFDVLPNTTVQMALSGNAMQLTSSYSVVDASDVTNIATVVPPLLRKATLLSSTGARALVDIDSGMELYLDDDTDFSIDCTAITDGFTVTFVNTTDDTVNVVVTNSNSIMFRNGDIPTDTTADNEFEVYRHSRVKLHANIIGTVRNIELDSSNIHDIDATTLTNFQDALEFSIGVDWIDDSTYDRIFIKGTGSYGAGNIALRGVHFYSNGTRVPYDTDWTITSTTGTTAVNAFDTTSVTGGSAGNQWTSTTAIDQVLCLDLATSGSFDFDEIRLYNAHNTGADTDQGVQNIEVLISTDAATTVYADVAGTVLFDGVLPEHIAQDVEDVFPIRASLTDTTSIVDYLENRIGTDRLDATVLKNFNTATDSVVTDVLEAKTGDARLDAAALKNFDTTVNALVPTSLYNSAGALALTDAHNGNEIYLDSTTDAVTIDTDDTSDGFNVTFTNTTANTISVAVTNATSIHFRDGGAVTDLIANNAFDVPANSIVKLLLEIVTTNRAIILTSSNIPSGGAVNVGSVTGFDDAVKDIIAPVSILNSAGAYTLAMNNRGAHVVLDSNDVADVITVDGTIITGQFFTSFTNITTAAISVTISNVTSVNFRNGDAINDIVADGSFEVSPNTTIEMALSGNAMQLTSSDIGNIDATTLTNFQDALETSIELEGIAAATYDRIFIKCTGSHGDLTNVGLRGVHFYSNGTRVPYDTDWTIAATTTLVGTDAEHIFDNTVLIDGINGQGWLSTSITDQVISIDLATSGSFDFDEIRLYNAHNTGADTDQGVQNIELFVSTDVATTVYADVDGTSLFSGVLPEHVAQNIEDPFAIRASLTDTTSIVDHLESRIGTDRLDATVLKNFNTATDSVVTDVLEAKTGDDRLDATALKNLDTAVNALVPTSIYSAAGALALTDAHNGNEIYLDSTDAVSIDTDDTSDGFNVKFTNTTANTISVAVTNATSIHFRDGGDITDLVADNAFDVPANSIVKLLLEIVITNRAIVLTSSDIGVIDANDLDNFQDALETSIELEGITAATYDRIFIKGTGSYGAGNIALRGVHFYSNGTRVPYDTDWTITSTTGTAAVNAFDTTSVTGGSAGNQWISTTAIDQVLCLDLATSGSFDFDEIRLYNAHNTGADTDQGVANIEVLISTAVATVVYADVTGTVLFDGVLPEHIAQDVEDVFPIRASLTDTTSIVDHLESRIGTDRLDATVLKNFNTATDSVVTDVLEAKTGDDRLDATVLKNLDTAVNALVPTSIYSAAGALTLTDVHNGNEIYLDSTDAVSIDTDDTSDGFNVKITNTTANTISVAVTNATSIHFRDGGDITDLVADNAFDVPANSIVKLLLEIVGTTRAIVLTSSNTPEGGVGTEPRLLDDAAAGTPANLVIQQGETIHIGNLNGTARTMTIAADVTFFQVIDWGGLGTDNLTITLNANDGIVLAIANDNVYVAQFGGVWSMYNYRGDSGHTQIS